jgi:DNA-binding LacI/PurR family transcriptional regulator
MVTDSPRRQPTLDQVAERAGVSRTAASRVINNAPYVSRAKREAVERAIRDLGYVPNRTARALATQQTGVVVLAISLAEPAIFADPFFARIVVGVSAALDETDLHLILCLAASPRGEARLQSLLRTRGVDGIMPMSVHGVDDPLGRLVERSHLPAVFGGRPLRGEPRWYVDADNYGGARSAVEYLIGLGRKRIAIITGPIDTNVSEARLRGYREALAIAGLPSLGQQEGDFTDPGGAAAMEALLATDPDLDAVFVSSDNMALGALRVLRRCGRAVPGDVAVIGFDDVRAAHTDPPLTTVRQPIEAMGREMARMLVAVLDGHEPTPLILPTTLIVRSTT